MYTTLKIAFRLTFLSIVLIGISCAKPTASDQRPNILLIITDDQGYGDLSCHGNPWLKTPHIDELHSQSTRLTDFHVSPTCSPTRAALLTGHSTNRTGAWHTVGGRSMIRESEVTIADVLKENGYATAMFGKWHLGDNFPFRPQDRGFEEVIMHGGGGVGQQPDYWSNDYFDDHYFHNGEAKPYKGYCTDVWFEEASKYISEKANSEKPFFCYLSTNAPHGPYYVEDKYSDKYKGIEGVVNPYYYGMVDNIDENVGALMNLLDSLKLAENTMVIFMTDNGVGNGAGLVLEKWNGNVARGYNAGMRGAKVSMYEGGHRVPFFVRWPKGGVKAGKDIDELTAHVDFFPTLVEMLALNGAESLKFDGTSLYELLTGKKDTLAKRTLITDTQRIEYPEKWRMSSTMQDKWRLINGIELYNITDDPGQRNDVAEQYPEKVAELRADYETWWEDIKPAFEEYPAIRVCVPQEPVTLINTMDMHADSGRSEVPWHQKHIRKPLKNSGWYAVKFPEDGTYSFTLYRYPPEAKTGITQAYPADNLVEGANVEPFAAGEVVAIKEARVDVDGKTVSAVVDGMQPGCTVQMEVKKGFHRLRAEFVEENGAYFAAFYFKVEKLW